MSDGRGQSSSWAWDLPRKVPQQNSVGLASPPGEQCMSDGRRSTAIANEHEITRRSFGSRLPRSHQGQLGWQRWERPMERQTKVAPAKGSGGRSEERPERVSRRLPSYRSLTLSFFFFLLFRPLRPCLVGCHSRSVDFLPREPNPRRTPSSDRSRWDSATANAQTQSISRPRPRHPQTASSPLAMHLRRC